jgi:hypothetical protein
MSKRIFKPLNTLKGEIRLALLHCAKDPTTPIHCSLIQVSLSEAPPYSALSYVWGKSNASQVIVLDGDTMQVTPNLFQALIHLRDREVDFLLWIDALCIDQQSVTEKNNQVPRMREIYQSASDTFIWLGLWDQASKAAFQFFDQVASYTVCHRDEIGADGIFLQDLINHLIDEDLFNGKIWTDLSDFFSREYWYRAWIYQEFVVSKTLILKCGLQNIDYKSLQLTIAAMLPCLPLLGHSLPVEIENKVKYVINQVSDLMNHRRTLTDATVAEESSSYHLVAVILRNMWRLTSEPKDSVYAYLGVAEDQLEIVVDYNKSLQEIGMDVFIAHAKRTGDLNLLALSGLDAWNFGQHSNTPSWCPNFRLCIESRLEDQINPPAHTAYPYPFEGHFMRISGVRIDTIEKYTDLFDGQPQTLERWSRIFESNKLPDNPWQQTCYRTLMNHDLAKASLVKKALSLDEIEAFNPLFDSDMKHAMMSQVSGFIGVMGLASLQNSTKAEQEALNNQFQDANRSTETGYSHMLAIWSGTKTVQMSDDELIHHCFLGCDQGEWNYPYWDKDYNPSAAELRENIQGSLDVMRNVCKNRCLFVTAKGKIGLGPAFMKAQDIVCSIRGCSHPLVIRHCEGNHVVVGECYLEGYMNEELITQGDLRKLPFEIFLLR